MNFIELVKHMQDDSGVGYEEASHRAGCSPNYINKLIENSAEPDLDTCATIANAFGFRLIVRGNSVFYSIRRNQSSATHNNDISAWHALKLVTSDSSSPVDLILKATGEATNRVVSYLNGTAMPSIEAFIAVAEYCGDEVIVKGHGKLYYLSRKAEFSSSNRAVQLPSTGGLQKTSHNKAIQTRQQREPKRTSKSSYPVHGFKDLTPLTGSVGADTTREMMSANAQEDGNVVGEQTVLRKEQSNGLEVPIQIKEPESIDGLEGTNQEQEQELTDTKPLIVQSVIHTEQAPQTISQERAMEREEAMLAEYKKRLLDLSMRNNLLNYKDKKTGTLQVLVPDMITVYRRVVLNERPMTFRESSPEDDDQPVAKSDAIIETERSRAVLMRCLRRLDTVARSSIEEQGINILYLAFGMLHWIDESDSEHTAPIVLAPVRLTRASAKSSYVLQAGDDDPVLNPTLEYFLVHKYGIQLSSFEKEDQLQLLLNSVIEQVQSRKGWYVTTEVVLSTFQFQKLSMYHDLEARSREILAHPIVRAIMGDGSALDEVAELDNPDSFKPTDTYQVVDADASQQAAILAAHAGESFVLQGPPGTGKSQTITNIIADCLGSGKKVLFVSEKKAALDVVHRRLKQAKLDDFCLVLHSNKAGKKEVLSQLAHTLNLYGTYPLMSANAPTRLNAMVKLRDELNEYANDIYRPIEPLGRSPYEIIGAVLKDEEDDVPWFPCHIADIKSLNPDRVRQMTDAVRAYARALGGLGEPPEKNPWNTFGIYELEYGESGDIVRAFSQISKGARDLMDIWRRLTTKLEVDVPPTYDALEATVSLLDDLSKMPVVPLGVSENTADESRALIAEWERAQSDLASSVETLSAALSELGRLDPVLNLRLERGRLLEVGYANELAKKLDDELRGLSHYQAWQMASEADIDAAIVKLRGRISSYERHRGTILADYHPELLEIDFIAMETRFKTDYQSFFKRMFGQHGDDIRKLTALRRSSNQVDDEEATRILGLLHDLSNEERNLDEQSEEYASLLGECYRGMRTDFEQLARRREAFKKAQECQMLLSEHEMMTRHAYEVGRKASDTFGYLYDSMDQAWGKGASRVIDSLDCFKAANEERPFGVRAGHVIPLLAEDWLADIASELSEELRAILKQCRPAFKKAIERACGTDFRRRSLDQLAEVVNAATSAGELRLQHSVAYTRARRICLELGLEGFVKAIAEDNRALEPGFLDKYERILRHTLYRIWLGSVALAERPSLRDFSAREHEHRVERFTELDAEQLGIDQTRALRELFPRIPSPNVRARGKDEISVLVRELNKKARIRPIRKLFGDIPHAVLALKPCLMMSPLSVSTYLESATFQFDTVIFDEASQVRTEDALGVISRGKQVIIAGDSKQLPPTNFFAATVSEGDDEGDDEYYEQAGSFDSVLDEAALLNPISLKWHYRSRDESLITFSNEEIYDGELFTFPSNRTGGRDSGVEYIYVPNGIYEGSRKGNSIEAVRVADLIMTHFATYGTERSLGVIALGENQARIIEDKLLELRIANPHTERFFDTGTEEPFFIKNLENVQGDERDTIILSVGYAKGPNGRLSHNFGPINNDGGERRLNVAVTRARVNLKLVTSLDPSEIDSSRVSNVGPRMLKDYLSYAKIGYTGDGAALLREYGYVDEDAFAGVVRDTLTDSGFIVEERVGRSGCKVDLAVCHPKHTDCYCIGIVCDGDSYHAATTARDRDRLRTQVLCSMGWRLYHAWSSAWLQDPERQKELLLNAVKDAVESFVPAVEREPLEMAAESASEDQDTIIAVVDDTADIHAVSAAPQVQMSLGLEEASYEDVGQIAVEHRYGFQDYPEYTPPRRGLASDLEVLKQLIFAQAPFSVDYFLQKYREYCYEPGQRMTDAVRRSGMGYIQTKLKDLVIVRKEHGVDYVFRKDQRYIIPRIAGGRNIADISTSELREGALAVLRGYVGELNRESLIAETSAAFEFARKGRIIEQRINEAIDDLRVYGKVKIVDGYYIPTSRNS